MAKDLAIVLNNGGINSAVVTAMAAQRYRPVMIFADSSPGEGARKRAAYDQQVAHFKPYREYSVAIAQAGGAPAQNLAAAADPRQGSTMAPQMLDLLPLLSAAVRSAAHHQAAAIYVGMRVGPDTDDLAKGTEFFQIWNEMIQVPCGMGEMEILAPLLELEAWQVVEVGFQVGAPFERTWSCLEESSEPCGSCRGCRAREAAFQQAGKPDPKRVVARKS
jgi:7-cyano-7-deazaguanine synthase in queuosine biosynthesis